MTVKTKQNKTRAVLVETVEESLVPVAKYVALGHLTSTGYLLTGRYIILLMVPSSKMYAQFSREITAPPPPFNTGVLSVPRHTSAQSLHLIILTNTDSPSHTAVKWC